VAQSVAWMLFDININAPIMSDMTHLPLADPYYVAKEEVERTITRAQELHTEWKRLLYSENTAKSQRFQSLHMALCGDIQQLDVDLQDLEATVRMVEGNRARFQMSKAEVASRNSFVNGSRARVRELQESLSSSTAVAKMEADRHELLLPKQVGRRQEANLAIAHGNQRFLETEKQTQAEIMRRQDETLELIGGSAGRLLSAAEEIHGELGRHSDMLWDLDQDMARETEKLNFVMKRVGLLLKTGESKQISLIVGLFFLMLVQIFLIINT